MALDFDFSDTLLVQVFDKDEWPKKDAKSQTSANAAAKTMMKAISVTCADPIQRDWCQCLPKAIIAYWLSPFFHQVNMCDCDRFWEINTI
eukprot:3579176-Amphidinium_carterae.1